MASIHKIAIIGGGPSGMYAAWLLQQRGFDCTVFDHRIPWEKPCGGGITSKAFGQFPILDDCLKEMQTVSDFTIISPRNKEATLSQNASLHIISRKVLSDYMLQKATAVGVRHIAEKVTGLQKEGASFTLKTVTEHTGFDFVIGADGANGVSRNLLGAKPFNKDRMGAMGYYINGLTDQKVVIKFYKNFQGYLWMFPRPGHASVGVGFPSGTCSKKEVRKMVDHFLGKYYPQYATADDQYYAATIPYVTEWQAQNVQGQGWALIGDAGGFTDAITGEGIYYAFKSAELLAQCIISGKPADYFKSSREEREVLHRSYTLSPRFYQNRTLELLVLLCKRSAFVRQLSARLIMGQQSYIGLKQYIKHNAWTIVKQIVGSTFKK